MQFDFLPPSIMPKFIVRLHEDIEDTRLQWRKGVVLANGIYDAKAVVRSDPPSKLIEVFVEGSQSKDYFVILLDNLRRIYSEFKGLPVEELIPCNCAECSVSKSPFYHDYHTLIKFRLKGRPAIPCSQSTLDVSITGLLSEVDTGDAVTLEKIFEKISGFGDDIQQILRELEKDELFEFKPGVPGCSMNLKVAIKRIIKGLDNIGRTPGFHTDI